MDGLSILRGLPVSYEHKFLANHFHLYPFNGFRRGPRIFSSIHRGVSRCSSASQKSPSAIYGGHEVRIVLRFTHCSPRFRRENRLFLGGAPASEKHNVHFVELALELRT